MLRSDRGQTAAEYMGLLLIVSLVVAALATSSLASGVSGQVSELVCRIAGSACDGPGATTSADADALTDRLAALAPLLNGSGGALAELAAAAQAAIDRGDLAAAEDLIERLELYRDLIAAGPRGELIEDLVAPSDADFAALLERGTIQFDGGAHNLRYFQVPPEPGATSGSSRTTARTTPPARA
jgi:hypothetical protein